MSRLKVLRDFQEDWRSILRTNFNRVEKLADFLEISEEERSLLLLNPKFAIQVPLRLAKKMTKGTLNDPLTRQFLPLLEELVRNPDFIAEPVCDGAFQAETKLLQKYKGRVLLLTTGACAMHCRYCFRQNYSYEGSKNFEEEIEWIRANPSIHEVILSGGDPLSLSDHILEGILEPLASMSHVKRIRFHTRFLIGIPERINGSFLQILSKIPQEIYIVIHCNHVRELDEDVLLALNLLRNVGCVLLNQAVLLKGVNDDVKTLTELSEELVNHGVLPYYLHQLDRVSGAGHFEVSEEEGKRLVAEMAKELPGYAVPKYVREIPYELNKTVL